MYRDRRQNIRRVFEVGEIIPKGNGVTENILYKWNPSSDRLEKANPSTRLLQGIKTYTNLSDAEIARNLSEKKQILEWMLEKDINSVEEVGSIISEYYSDPDSVLSRVHKK